MVSWGTWRVGSCPVRGNCLVLETSCSPLRQPIGCSICRFRAVLEEWPTLFRGRRPKLIRVPTSVQVVCKCRVSHRYYRQHPTGSKMKATRALLVLLTFVGTFAFNLESRIPIIKVSPNQNHTSYFGFSVAAHKIQESTPQNLQDFSRSRILVGAPKLNNVGGVYNCPLTADKNDCQELDIEEPPAPEEIREGQWLGVTVRSQKPGGHVLACAHRYVRASPSNARWGWGICHTLTADLDWDNTWIPCEGRSTAKAHEEFGYCQAGTSGTISTEDNNVIIGLPGPFTWKGTVFATSILSGGIDNDKQLYLGPLDDKSPVEKYSYLGMSVTSGVFFGNDVSYVAGAPRSNGTGQVVFFSKTIGNPTLLVHSWLSGDTFASSYGYELVAINLNNDNYLDLVVGAPFYYGKDAGGAIYVYMNGPKGFNSTAQLKITGKPESRFGLSLANLKDLNQDGYDDLAVGAPYDKDGAVFIFLGSSNGIGKEPNQVIRPEYNMQGPSFKTFGYSLSGGVDLDNNGYPDLVVGAYEADKVAYYRSRPIIDIVTNVTGNLTNIDPQELRCNDVGDAGNSKVCFSFTACFKLKSASKVKASRLKIQYTLTADTAKVKSRFNIKRASEGHKNIMKREIILTSRNFSMDICFPEVAFQSEPIGDVQTPIKFQLSYSLVQNTPVQGSRTLININDFPILNKTEAVKAFEASFAKECGDNDICESDLDVQARISLTNGQLILGTFKELTLSLSISNNNDSAYEAATYITYPSYLDYIATDSEGLKISCKPNITGLLICQLGNPFKRTPPNEPAELVLRFNADGVPDDAKEMEISIMTNTTSHEISPEPDTVLSAPIVRKADIAIIGKTYAEQIFFGGSVRGETAMKHEDDIGMHDEHHYIVTNNGPWKVGNITVNISWPYEVENKQEHGKWLLYIIETPVVAGGKGFCDIKPEYVNKLGLQINPAYKFVSRRPESQKNMSAGTQNLVEPGSESVGKGGASRTKREVVIYPEQKEIKGKMQKVVTMDCLKNTAKCFNFRCYIFDLKVNQSLTIKIRARLWNSTFVEDYFDVDMVSVISRANIYIDPKYEIEQDTSNDYALAETIAYPEIVPQEPQPVPLWVIIVSAVAGLIVLIIIILILWKVGFFRRKKREEMMTGKVEKSKDVNNSGY